MPTPQEALDGCGRALRRAVPALAVVAGITTVGAGMWCGWRFLTSSPQFAISSIELHGATHVSRDQALDLLPFSLGTNVFRVDIATAEAALRRHPWVDDVAVHRELPDTIVVEVREHRAAAMVDAGELYLVDDDGRPFKRAALGTDDAIGLPIVSGIPRDLYREAPAEARARVQRGLAVLAAWRSAGRPQAGEVAVDDRGTTVFTWDDAVAVRLGDAVGAELTARLARFDAAWAALSPDERRRTESIHADNDTRSDLVTIAFASH